MQQWVEQTGFEWGNRTFYRFFMAKLVETRELPIQLRHSIFWRFLFHHK
jgi:hypothetical protein